MKLYEIDRKLEELVDPETGELLDFDTFQQLQIEKTEKIESMALWYKNVSAEAKAVKEEADALIKRGKSLENMSERLKAYIGMILDGEKFSTPRCSVSYRKSASLEIDDSQAVIDWAERTSHAECVRYKPPEVAKQAVSELLKQGVEVPGAEVKTKRNVTIR